FAARSWSSQKPAAPISSSSAVVRWASAAGSKIVREQLELPADGREPLRKRRGRGGGHAGAAVSNRANVRFRLGCRGVGVSGNGCYQREAPPCTNRYWTLCPTRWDSHPSSPF